MTDFNSQNVVGWLTNPLAYSPRPGHVDVVETHISFIFLAGQFVYKLKRPVKYDFLDFTTLDSRETACREEVRLNRRLAPNVYLGVVPIMRRSDGTLHLGGEGSVVDWLVHMRRLPTENTLDALQRRGELHPSHIAELSNWLADFYRSLTPLPIEPQEYRERYTAHVLADQGELLAVSHHCPKNTVRRIHSFQLQRLKLQSELFDERVCNGRVVEGHGDLRPEHICFTNPIAIFDCVEFSLDFRRIDIADELCFLAAECDFIGADWVGPLLWERFQSLSCDRPPPQLLAFYKSYRACVRAKVAALRADQLDGTQGNTVAAEALKHLDYADSYIRPWARPIILMVGGLSGTGKSTLAAEIANALGCELLRTDVIRKELHTDHRDPVPYGSGNYASGLRQKVYDEMFCRANSLHADGVSLVLDGTFSMSAVVNEALRMAVGPRSVLLGIECFCQPVTALKRIALRLAGGEDPSQAKPEYYEQQQKQWEPWPAELPQCRVNTEQPLEEQLRQVLAELRHRLNNSTSSDQSLK